MFETIAGYENEIQSSVWLNIADKAPSEASFRGTEYLTIDLSKNEPVLSTQESVSLQFKTRQSNGLLFYSGKSRDGDLVVDLDLRSC